MTTAEYEKGPQLTPMATVHALSVTFEDGTTYNEPKAPSVRVSPE